jgi:hypothetical protein
MQIDQVLLMKGILISTLMIIASWSTRVLRLCQKMTNPESIRKKFETYTFSVGEKDKLALEKYAQIKALFSSLKRKGKVEKFYSKYFALVPLNATEYFPNLSSQLAVLLATRVADKIVSFSKLNESNSTPAQANVTTKDLTEKEKAALQYLGGYVLLALNKRIQQSKKWKTASREH